MTDGDQRGEVGAGDILGEAVAHLPEDTLVPPPAPTDESGKPMAGVGYWPMYAIGLIFMVDQLDQNILRGVLVQIQEEMSLSDFQLGLLSSSFVLVHALAIIPAGYLADRWNRKRTIGWTIILWSLITALTGACQNFVQIFIVRASLGMGQALTEPAANSLLADYYPPKHRGKAFSIQQVFFFIGAGAGLAIGGAIGQRFGWRWAFVVAGLPGMVFALVAFALREPKRGFGDRVAAGVATEFEPEDAADKKPLFDNGVWVFFKDMITGLGADMKTIAKIPTLRYSLVGVTVLLFTVTGLAAWLPLFYVRYANLPENKAAAYVGIVVAIGGIGGTLIGGRVADKYSDRIKGARVVIPAYCIFVTATLFAISFLSALDAYLLIRLGIQLVAMFVMTMAIPALRAGISDAVPATLRGAGFAAFALVSAVGGAALAPTLIGWLSGMFQPSNLRWAFWIVMPPTYVGAWVLLRARHHLDDDAAKILQAVVEAMQKQRQEEDERALAGSVSVDGGGGDNNV